MYRKSDAVIRRPLSVTIDDPEPFAGERSLFPESRAWRIAASTVRILGGILLADPADPAPGLRVGPNSPIRRFLRGLMLRLMFAPFLLAITVGALVYAGTHPRVIDSRMNPAWSGLTYAPLEFSSKTGTPVQAWLMTAAENSRAKSPAVILIPGHAATRAQILPLIKPLHDAGFTTMALALRGQETAQPAARTFGLDESVDAKAALAVLRERPDVDAHRVALVGLGTGANAAILAADNDPAIGALVLDDPLPTGDAAIQRYITLKITWLKWLTPLCRFAFGAAYGQDIDRIGLDRHDATIQSHRCLFLDDVTGSQGVSAPQVNQIVDFLRNALQGR